MSQPQPDKILEEWTGENGEQYQYVYFEAHEKYGNERMLMLIVSNHPQATPEQPMLYAATSFTEDFGKGLGPAIIEQTKQQMLKALDFGLNGDRYLDEARERRKRWLDEHYKFNVEGLDK